RRRRDRQRTSRRVAPQEVRGSRTTVNERLARLCVSPEATICETMAAIDAGAAEVALLVGPGDQLVALATDGDVRRALLAGQSLDAPIAPFAQRAFVSVEEGTSRADVLELMHARFVNQ